MTIDLATGNKRHQLAERGADLYETPPVAVEALLKVEKLPKTIWEPAAGPGSIVATLRDLGHTVIATDLHPWGCPNSLAGVDFLRQERLPAGAEIIVTNPPYALAADFVRHAKRLCPRVIMLLRLGFIESQRRSDILDDGTLARIYPFANRLPMMHRHGWEGPKSSSAMAFAWYVWDRENKGPTQLQRLRWTAKAEE